MTEATLVVGFGSELRGDDALGRRVAEAAEGWAGVRALSVHQLTPELADDLAGCERVIFADAVAGGSGPRVVAVEPREGAPRDPHGLEPEDLLALCRDLHGRAPEAWLLLLPGEEFDRPDSLSHSARATLRRATEMLKEMLDDRDPP